MELKDKLEWAFDLVVKCRPCLAFMCSLLDCNFLPVQTLRGGDGGWHGCIPACPVGDLPGFPSFLQWSQLSPCHCGYLGSEPANWSLLSLFLPFK